MKIMIVAMKFFPDSGGSATYSYNLAVGLQRRGHQITLLAPSYRNRRMNDGEYPFRVRRMALTDPTRFSGLRVFSAAFQILMEYRSFKPDAIWATSFAGARVMGLITSLKSRLVATLHGGGIHRRYPSRKIAQKITDRLGLRFMHRADALVTVSEESRKIIAGKIPFDDILKKLVIIYNSIDFDEARFVTAAQARKLLPRFGKRKIILTVSRLIKAKGHDVVIRALASLVKKFPDIVYLIVGEGEERRRLEDLVSREGLRDRVVFTGYVSEEELEAYYAICDVFVMAGRWTQEFVEGFGLVYIEAGVRGKPVIGTRVGGIPEAIIENKTGFVIEPDDPSALAERISLLLKKAALRKKMSAYAMKHLREMYSNDVMAHNSETLLRNLITE